MDQQNLAPPIGKLREGYMKLTRPVWHGWRHWLGLSRYRKSQHMTRWLMAILLIGSGLALDQANIERPGTPMVMEMYLPLINFHTFANLTLFAGILALGKTDMRMWQFALLCSPIFIFTIYTVFGVAFGLIPATSFAGIIFFVILCALLMVVFYGFSEPDAEHG